jgi:hypothetical protein
VAGLFGCTEEPAGGNVNTGGSGSATGGAGGNSPSGGTAGDSATGGNGPTTTASMCVKQALPSSPLALLTRAQYDNTISDLLLDDSKPAGDFPPENQVQGFKNNTAAHQASPLAVEKYLEAAEGLAARAVANRLSTLAPCASNDYANCGRAFVRNFGLKAFRRPLTNNEAQLFDDLFGRTLPQSNYSAAVLLVLQAFLQSPQFLYRVDARRAPTPESGALPLGPYELAARLSYFLTGSMPDDALFAAAAKDELRSDADVETQARRLLELPRARAVVREFHHQWLGLDGLPSIVRDAPDLDTAGQPLGKDWLDSFDRFVDDVYWESGNASSLFDSKRVYLNDRLAPIYGASVSGSDFRPVEQADRAGLVTQPALLALLAHGDQSAPVLRGVFVLERLMCVVVPPPPPTVNNSPPDPNPNLTTRERFRVHTENPDCAGCHRLIDGVGFGFEGYDQLGRYRTIENGLPIDVSGEVIGGDDPTLLGPFNGANELAGRLAQSARVRDCVAASWYRFALGRLETEADKCSLDEVKASFAKNSGDLRELMVAITRSVAFRYRPAIGDGGP